MSKKTASASTLKVVKSKPAAKNSYAGFSLTPCSIPTSLTQLLEETMAQNTNQFDKMAKEATAAGRENFEAFTKSYSIFTKGCESLIRTSVEISQTAAEKQASYAKEALSCKTINEFAEIQNKIAQANFDDFMSGFTKLSEISTKLVQESAEPLNEQINKTVQKMSTAA